LKLALAGDTMLGLRLRLALAHYSGTVAALVGEVQAQLAALDARKPLPTAPR
jgi:hypothetical protein